MNGWIADGVLRIGDHQDPGDQVASADNYRPLLCQINNA
jgi:hypothetical protein